MLMRDACEGSVKLVVVATARVGCYSFRLCSVQRVVIMMVLNVAQYIRLRKVGVQR
jgi:hypothetical protein